MHILKQLLACFCTTAMLSTCAAVTASAEEELAPPDISFLLDEMEMMEELPPPPMPTEFTEESPEIEEPVISSPASVQITLMDSTAVPDSLDAGSKVIVNGTLLSESSPITSVTVGIYSTVGTLISGRADTPNAFSYDLRLLDSHVLFNKLPSGNYVYRVAACNAAGKLFAEEQSFSVLAPPAAEAANGLTYINGILIANKSYPLPKDYNPGGLLPETQNAFDKMASDAVQDGIRLWISSGFRSYAYQSTLYDNYVACYGKAEADTFAARPGYSEHQTGLALDINDASDSFLGTPEQIWLADNCWKYGFIIRYPEGKQHITGYKYEPWHVRYLGKDTARSVYRSGLSLEEYLGIDSVYE